VRGAEARKLAGDMFSADSALDHEMRTVWRQVCEQRWAEHTSNRFRRGTEAFLSERKRLREQFEEEQVAMRLEVEQKARLRAVKEKEQASAKSSRSIEFHQFPWGTVEGAVQKYEEASSAAVAGPDPPELLDTMSAAEREDILASMSLEERSFIEEKERIVLAEKLKTIAAGRQEVSKMREEVAKLHAKRARLEVGLSPSPASLATSPHARLPCQRMCRKCN